MKKLIILAFIYSCSEPKVIGKWIHVKEMKGNTVYFTDGFHFKSPVQLKPGDSVYIFKNK